MHKVDDLASLKLKLEHYHCIQCARALQFTAADSKNALMCTPSEALKDFIMAMSPFYLISDEMWVCHTLTQPFQKPPREINPYNEATQYFDGLPTVIEEAIHFE